MKLIGIELVTLVINLNFSIFIVRAENILFVIGAISSYSHRDGLEPLAYKLADRGHKVTFLNPFPPSKAYPNVTEFLPPALKYGNDLLHEEYGVVGLKSRIKKRFAAEFIADYGYSIYKGGIAFCQGIFASPEFQDWMKTAKFDLVILDKGSVTDCMFGLAHKLGAKTIGYMGLPMLVVGDYFNYGIPYELWFHPMLDVSYETDEPGFIHRVKSWWSMLHWLWNYEMEYLPALETMVRETLNMPDMPPLKELAKRDNLMLFNIHAADHFVKALPPFVVTVGGLHLKDTAEPLPKDLKQFMSGAKDGVIYISFGSIVKISIIPPELIEIFFDTMKSLQNYRFLCKWEGEKPKNVPENAFLQPWFPQQDVLAHPKIRGFITQGGQISLQQAIHNGVPVIVFPVNGDQDFNAKRVRSAGNGITMELCGLTAEDLQKSIFQLVEKKSFSRVAQKLKKISRDRPMSPVDTAVWWTEYVLRHDDTHFLKPLIKPWWMMLSLDVFGLVLLVTLASVLILLFLLLQLLKLFRKTDGKNANKKVKKLKQK